MSVLKSGGVRVVIHVVRCDVLFYFVAFVFDVDVFPVLEALNREAFAKRVIYAIEAALFEPGEIECRFAKNLAGNRAGIDAGATEFDGALNQRDALAKITGLSGGLFAGRAGTDYDEVVTLQRAHSRCGCERRLTFPLVNEIADESGPAGLVTCTKAGARVAMEVFVKKQKVTPVRV